MFFKIFNNFFWFLKIVLGKFFILYKQFVINVNPWLYTQLLLRCKQIFAQGGHRGHGGHDGGHWNMKED